MLARLSLAVGEIYEVTGSENTAFCARVLGVPEARPLDQRVGFTPLAYAERE
jgi:hypothetical protein